MNCRKQFAACLSKKRDTRSFLACRNFSVKGFTLDSSARPTRNRGLTGSCQGEGSKTIVPAWARAKITTRLVPDQSPERIIKLVDGRLQNYVRQPSGQRSSGHGADPYLVSRTGVHAQSSLCAVRSAFGC
jgi:acetylornithine deacetylase/succinyl-diaminopimelate desuccinylase-like protein